MPQKKRVLQYESGFKGKHHSIEAKKKLSEARNKKVIQLNKNTLEIIQEFNSALEASKITGIDNSCIGNVCLGKQKTAGGFKWKFKENN